jgi:RNA polymerase sigma-70 factor, ECF subfamily
MNMVREVTRQSGRAGEFDRLRDLMVRAREGDGHAMGDLLRGLSPKLRGYIRRQLLNSGRTDPADTEDLLQITLLAIHAKQHTYDASQPLSGWVYAIARYKVVDHLRATQRKWSETSLDEAFDIAAVDEIGAAEAGRDLGVLLATLPVRTRSLIEAVKLEGMTAAEAAKGAGMSEAAVKVAIHRGLRRLTALFGKSPP